MYDAILERISPFLKGIYPLRPPLFYPLIAGYLFGFPLGSKLCADLYDLGKISKNEAVRVSCIAKADAKLQIKGRHDPCIVPRAAVVQNTLAAFAVLDLLTVRYGTLGQK